MQPSFAEAQCQPCITAFVLRTDTSCYVPCTDINADCATMSSWVWGDPCNVMSLGQKVGESACMHHRLSISILCLHCCSYESAIMPPTNVVQYG